MQFPKMGLFDFLQKKILSYLTFKLCNMFVHKNVHQI